MYQRRMQQIRRHVHERRAHEAQRQQRAAGERERMRAIVHAAVR
jgi:hypothetical protein